MAARGRVSDETAVSGHHEAGVDLEVLHAHIQWPQLSVTVTAKEIKDADDDFRRSLILSTPICESAIPRALQPALDELASRTVELDRAMGCLSGLLIGDSIGYPLAALPVVASTEAPGAAQWNMAKFVQSWRDTNDLQTICGVCLWTYGYTAESNHFKLHTGQWTGHGIAALCMADSVLQHEAFDAADLRLWMWSSHVRSINGPYRNLDCNTFYHNHQLFNLGMTEADCAVWLASMHPGTHPAPAHTGGVSADGVGHVGSLTRLGACARSSCALPSQRPPCPLRASAYRTSRPSTTCRRGWALRVVHSAGSVGTRVSAAHMHAVLHVHMPLRCTQSTGFSLRHREGH